MTEPSISPLIAHTVRTRSGTSGMLPSFFWPVFTAIHYVHRYTYWKAKLERIPKNYGLDYVPGVALEVTCGKNEKAKLLAKVNEVALHTFRAIQDLKRLKESFSQLADLTFKKEYYYDPLDWDQFSDNLFFSLSTRVIYKERYRLFVYKTKLISDCLLNILKDSYLLSRDLMYAEFAWEGHPFQVIEAGANIMDMKQELEGVKVDLLKGLGLRFDQQAPVEPEEEDKIPIYKRSWSEIPFELLGVVVGCMDYVESKLTVDPLKYVTCPPPYSSKETQIFIQINKNTLQ